MNILFDYHDLNNIAIIPVNTVLYATQLWVPLSFKREHAVEKSARAKEHFWSEADEETKTITELQFKCNVK